MCIRDLERILSFTQTKTSRHLTHLKYRGIVNSRRHHQWVFYQIKEEAIEFIEHLLQFVSHDAVLAKDQQEYLKLEEKQEVKHAPADEDAY